MKKYLIPICLIANLMLCITCYASGINVCINGTNVNFDTPPIIHNDRTLVPMRKIFEEFGFQVEWLSETQTIIVTQNSRIIALQIGKSKIIYTDIKTNMTSIIQSDTPPIIYNNRTLIPIRVISEALGYTVEWNGEDQSVIITTS